MKNYIGIITFMGFTMAFIILFSYLTPEPKQPTEGIPHNYWFPHDLDSLLQNEWIITYDSVLQDTVLIKEDRERILNQKDSIDILSAIMFIESGYDDSAYCKSEDAVGCLQIRQCMVDDVNRILKRQKNTLRFTYNSRWYRDSSIQMFEIYCDYYRLETEEEIARCWNGGPRGINNPATVGYWKKVKNKINS